MQKKMFSLFWCYGRRYKLLGTLTILASAAATFSSGFAGPLILAQFFNRIQAGNVSLASSWQLIVAYSIVQILGEIVFWRIVLYVVWKFDANVMRDIYTVIFRKLTTESMEFHANRFSGSLISQATKFVGAFERLADSITWTLIPMTVSIVASVCILWFFYWQYALFVLTVSSMFTVAAFAGTRFMAERTKAEAQAQTKLHGYLADVVTNIATVKSFGREIFETKAGHHHAALWRRRSLHTMRGVLVTTSTYSTLLAIINTGAFVFAVLAISSHAIAIGTVYLCLTYTVNVGRQLWEINNFLRDYNRVIGDAYDMTAILSTPAALVDSSSAVLTVSQGSITFEHVAFTHDSGNGQTVFEDLNLSIPAGQRIGLVGHSGSGKSTLVRILLRFSDVQKGAIYVDSHNIADVTQTSLHEQIAMVSQEPILFHRSLAENIAYGKPDATREEIIRAAKLANAWEFIKDLPNGLKTEVGERGVKLSGGQKQRVAIARAILKDAPILVLDEATSALDSESERLIQSALHRLMQGRTSIVIAHRLSTIAGLDRIIVLDHGRIVEDGTHAELLKRGGIYSSLWQHQSGGFITEDVAAR